MRPSSWHAEFMASVPKFKARPVNRKVMESAGDLGVPRVKRTAPTALKEFSLSTSSRSRTEREADDDASSDAGSTASAPATFKARPFNRALMEGKHAGLAQITPRKTTRACSPKLSTTARAAVRPPIEVVEQEAELFSSFKARPMPDMSTGPSPMRSPAEHRPITSPKPFNLESVSRHEMAEDKRLRMVSEARERASKQREFKARAMPIADRVWRPVVGSKHTTPRSFELSTGARSEVHSDRLEQQQAEAAADMKRQALFKARAPTVLSAPAFAPRKSTKPLTEINEQNLPFSKTEQQAKRRAELQKQMEAKRAAIEAAAAEKAKADAEKAAKDLVELRKKLVHKARPAPVLKQKAFVVSKVERRPLTQPRTPNLQTRDRSALRVVN